MLQNYHTEISVCSSVNGMQCRRHNKKQWETEYKVRRTFTWQRANLLPVKKSVSLGLILPPHFSFQLSRTRAKSNSEYYSFKSKEQIIDFPPSFWKQIAVNKASLQIWIEFHGLQFICLGAANCRQLDWNIHRGTLVSLVCHLFFYFQVSPSSTQTPRLSSRLSLVCS